MSHLDLTTSFQSAAGLASKRRIVLQTTDKNTVIAIEAAASASASSGVTIETLEYGAPSKTIDDGAQYIRYRVLSGTVTAAWVDADAAPVQGPPGISSGASWDKAAADSLAADTTAHYIFRADTARTIKAAYFIPDASLTSNSTNYATLSATVEDGAGGAVGTAASVTTKTSGGGGSGNWTAGTPVALTLGATLALTAGQVVKFGIAKAAAGVVVPAGRFQLDFA